MCFTVNVNIVKEELEERYGATLIDHDKYRPSYYYHAYSLPYLPVICSGDPGYIRMFRWGLIPAWVPDAGKADEVMLKTFNARSETADTKPFFRDSFADKRCIVPVRGFFEWQHIGGRKIPWYIKLKSEEIFSLAGLWDSWEAAGGVTLNTFSIMTTGANDLMSEIHNTKRRMPVILPGEKSLEWLEEKASPEELKSLSEPVSSDIMNAYTISPLITNSRADRNRPELIMPYNYPVQGLLF